MSSQTENSKNNTKEESIQFFPYSPYSQQINLMNFLSKSLLNTKDINYKENNPSYPKVILIENPTGTGNTTMILSCLLEYLNEVKNNNIKQKIDNTKNSKEDKKKKTKEKLGLIKNNIKKKRNKKKDENSSMKKEDKKLLSKNNNIISSLNFLNKKEDDIVKVENQVFYLTISSLRTNQIISKSKKLYDYYCKNISKFYNKKIFFPFSFLSSRNQLCLNKEIISKKNDINDINILCKKINEESEVKCKYKKFFFEKDSKDDFICEEMKTEIKDIEDLLKFGEEFNFCPYYMTHILTKSSQFIISPYDIIINNGIKNNNNINLKNNIIVFDKADKIYENILQCSKSDINTKELISLLIGFYLYFDKYKEKLVQENNLYIKHIIEIIEIFIDLIKEKKSNKEKEEYYIKIKLSDFRNKNGLNDYDIYQLIYLIEDSELTQKIQLIYEKEINNIKNDISNEYSQKMKDLLNQINEYIDIKDIDTNKYDKFINTYLQIYIKSKPLNKLNLILIGILNNDEDGILIYDIKLELLKFILINPINYFNYLLKEVKCLIFSGDTLKPFDDYYNLFPNLNKKQILKFEGDHIINQGNILHYIICNNIFCNNEILSFTNESMENDNDSLNIHYLLEYINQYYTLFKEKIIIKRTGIVVFFKSYNLMNKTVEYNNKNNILKIEKENLFFEKREKTDNNLNNKNDNKNNIFISFEKNIEKNNNVNIFFGVIGSKSFEETNFKDDSVGLLIIAGMPFPDINSFEIKEKMKFYDKLYNKKKSTINGNEYYDYLCMKKVNQTIGKFIKNYNDFSSIIFIDNGYSFSNYFNKLPKWIIREGKKIIQNKKDFDEHLFKLESFLNNKFKLTNKKNSKEIIYPSNQNEEDEQIQLAIKLSEEEANILLDLEKEDENQLKLAIEESKKLNNPYIDKKEEIFDEEYGICPITLEYMNNPVLTPSGKYYEKSAIIDWINKHHNDPFTRENLSVDMLIEDPEYKQKIIEYRKKFNK